MLPGKGWIYSVSSTILGLQTRNRCRASSIDAKANSQSHGYGEGNGNPLQYSCLENPVDRGAWWAAVHRVAQSRTRLKWLSMHAWEKKMTTHSSILAWRIPGTEEPGGLPSTGSHRVRHNWSDLAAAAVSWEPTLCISCQVNSHAGSLKLTRVGAFTPQKTANTTNQHYFSQKGGCLVCTSTPWLQTEDNWTLPIKEGNGEQGLCVYQRATHKYWKTSLCCACHWLDSYIFTYCTKAVTITDTCAAL